MHFAGKLIAKSVELYRTHNEALSGYIEIEATVKHLAALTKGLEMMLAMEHFRVSHASARKLQTIYWRR